MVINPVISIPASAVNLPGQEPDWKRQLREVVTDPEELLELLQLSADSVPIDKPEHFRLRVPRAYVDKMQPGDGHDPLLLQVLPQQLENSTDGLLDPVADLAAMSASGLLHKYHGRVLLITTGACAVHCRYCFRQHFPYGDACSSSARLDEAIRHIQQDASIHEVILSGGDPLVLDDERLAVIIKRLATIDHIDSLRIHTRLPVVLPARITGSLCRVLTATRLRMTMVIHANHANEIRQAESEVLQRLQAAGITLLNQSVLLKQVNDDADTLIDLSRRLHACHVLPYYLHLLDPVQGAMHFDVGEREACEILNRMRARLPGYLVPKLVREVPNSSSKTTISAI